MSGGARRRSTRRAARQGRGCCRASTTPRSAARGGAGRAPGPRRSGGEVEAAERAGLVRARLATLPAPQREAVELYYFDGLTCAELATRTAAAVGTAKGRLRLARAHLRAALTPVAAALD